MLETVYGAKFAEIDDYENGCLPETAINFRIDVKFKADTVDDLLEDIKNYFGVDDDAIELNSCDEIGRIDIATLENADGYNANESEIELWKQGKIELWACTYTYYVDEVKRTAFDFQF
jgi:hypothetical protein